MSRNFPQALFALLIAVLTIGHLSATTYYVAANGSDSNSGTSKTAPWAHLPGMRTWTGGHTPAAGDTFILRGCDDWGNSNFPINWNWSGTSSNPITIDRDTTWYNTSNCPSGWNRAKFDGGGAVMGGTECSGTNKFVVFNSATHVTVNWIELTGYYWNANAGGSCGDNTGTFVDANNSDYITWAYGYIHNWSHGSSAGDTDHAWDIVNGGATCDNCLMDHMVIDNTDSSVCGTGGTRCGAGFQWSTTNSVLNWMVNEIKPKTHGTFCNNSLSGVGMGFDGTHDNIIEPVGGGGGPNYYYICNNYIFDNAGGELQFGNAGDIYYIWNNIYVSTSGDSRSWAFPQQPGSGMSLYFWNNTIMQQAGSAGILTCNSCNPATWVNVDIENNHVITTSTSSNGPVPGLISCSPNDCGTNPFPASGSRVISRTDNIVMSPTTSTTQGYTDLETYVYSPTAATDTTVGAGNDLTSMWPAGFSSSDTTYACVQQAVSGVIQAVCDQRTPIARSGAWDAGAYEFQGGASKPNPPTGLVAAVQ
jgi:hypothetical protein